MDWAILAALFLVWITLNCIWLELRRVREEFPRLRDQVHKVHQSLSTRISSVAQLQTNTKPPHVDRPRTVQRDSSDLPAAGRMVMGIKRVKTKGLVEQKPLPAPDEPIDRDH